MTERFVNCRKCKWHNYDSYFGSDDEWVEDDSVNW